MNWIHKAVTQTVFIERKRNGLFAPLDAGLGISWEQFLWLRRKGFLLVLVPQ